MPSARFKSHAVTTFCRSAFERAVASESVFPAKSSRVPSARLKCRTVGLLYRNALEGGVAELPGISDPVFPTKSSSVPLVRLKSLTVGLLYRVALEACQRHAATFRARNHTKPKFCNTPLRQGVSDADSIVATMGGSATSPATFCRQYRF